MFSLQNTLYSKKPIFSIFHQEIFVFQNFFPFLSLIEIYSTIVFHIIPSYLLKFVNAILFFSARTQFCSLQNSKKKKLRKKYNFAKNIFFRFTFFYMLWAFKMYIGVMLIRCTISEIHVKKVRFSSKSPV